MYSGLALLYSNRTSQKKERLSTILEPLQSMVQLSLLSFVPIGSKLSIYENLLSIQLSNWNQSIIRNFYNDTKDDLYYLFNVLNRFNKFYVNKPKTDVQNNLYTLLNELAYNGLHKLIQTYKNQNSITIISTLSMYKSMIKNPKLCQAYENEKLNSEISYDDNNTESEDYNNQSDIDDIDINYTKNKDKKNENTIKNESLNIDDLFINIKSLYSNYHYELLYNFLLMIKNDEINHLSYINGINTLFIPINEEIKIWINTNLSC